jgi:hypothetical protein
LLIGLLIGLWIYSLSLSVPVLTPPHSPPKIPAALPSEQNGPLGFETPSALSSLEAFDQARRSWGETKHDEKRFSEAVIGRRVRWQGHLRYSLKPGTFMLASDPSEANASVCLMPATAETKRQVRRIPPDTKVEVEGVLMDDQWLHLMRIRAVE